jgi:hypothetical protein
MAAEGLKDFISKNHKLLLIIGIVVLAAVIVFHKEKSPTENKQPGKGKDNITAEERMKAELEGVRKDHDKQQKQIEELQKKLQMQPNAQQPDGQGGVLPPSGGRTQSLQELNKVLNRQPPPTGPGDASKQIPAQQLPSQQIQVPAANVVKPLPPRLLKIDVPEAPQPKSSKAMPQEDLYLTPGSFASFTLSSGTFAPETGEMMPVAGVIDKAFSGPNKSSIPLTGCYFLGKARGNTGFKIADIKAVKLACVWPDGKTFESEIVGYVSDLHGDFGLPGTVERHAGTFFATVGVSSFIEGLSAGMSRAQEAQAAASGGFSTVETTNITGSAATYGMLKGATDFSGAAKKFFEAQLTSLVPAVVVPAGSRGYLYITNGVTITGGRRVAANRSYYDNYNLSRTR